MADNMLFYRQFLSSIFEDMQAATSLVFSKGQGLSEAKEKLKAFGGPGRARGRGPSQAPFGQGPGARPPSLCSVSGQGLRPLRQAAKKNLLQRPPTKKSRFLEGMDAFKPFFERDRVWDHVYI